MTGLDVHRGVKEQSKNGRRSEMCDSGVSRCRRLLLRGLIKESIQSWVAETPQRSVAKARVGRAERVISPYAESVYRRCVELELRCGEDSEEAQEVGSCE